jgi:hypothetical protein
MAKQKRIVKSGQHKAQAHDKKAAAKKNAGARQSAASQRQNSDKALRDHAIYLLRGGGAHLDFETAVAAFPPNLRGAKAPGVPYTAWGLLEHMRIAQRDILEFSRNPKHVSPEWPKGYWPHSDAPAAGEWEKSIKTFQADLKAMQQLVASAPDVFARIPHGDGQTLLREALLIADHNSYHLGEFVLLRRLLGAWKE